MVTCILELCHELDKGCIQLHHIPCVIHHSRITVPYRRVILARNTMCDDLMLQPTVMQCRPQCSVEIYINQHYCGYPFLTLKLFPIMYLTTKVHKRKGD